MTDTDALCSLAAITGYSNQWSRLYRDSWQASLQSLFTSAANCQLSFPVMQSADNTLFYADTGSVMKPGGAFRSEGIADAVYNHLDDRFQAALATKLCWSVGTSNFYQIDSTLQHTI